MPKYLIKEKQAQWVFHTYQVEAESVEEATAKIEAGKVDPHDVDWGDYFGKAEYDVNVLEEDDQEPDRNMVVSLDGGTTYVPVSNDVRVIYGDQLMPGEDVDGELHVTMTHEGMILDVWADQTEPSEEAGTNLGTRSQTTEEIITELVEANS